VGFEQVEGVQDGLLGAFDEEQLRVGRSQVFRAT
jgi:hypothetical protein